MTNLLMLGVGVFAGCFLIPHPAWMEAIHGTIVDRVKKLLHLQ